jgi:hypothetical protein
MNSQALIFAAIRSRSRRWERIRQRQRCIHESEETMDCGLHTPSYPAISLHPIHGIQHSMHARPATLRLLSSLRVTESSCSAGHVGNTNRLSQALATSAVDNTSEDDLLRHQR